MELVIIGHILCDFYIQTDKVADNKKKSAWYMLLHCIIYMVGMYIVLVALNNTNLLEQLLGRKIVIRKPSCVS